MIGSTTSRLTGIAMLLLAVGLGLLSAYVLMESVASGISFVDAYWRGRLPWMGIAETLIVVGATATLVTGAVAVAVRGGRIRRLAVLPPLAIATLWWFVAMIPMRAVPCNDCPPQVPDPWAYAYSAPETTLFFLLAPAAVVLALALIRPSASGA